MHWAHRSAYEILCPILQANCSELKTQLNSEFDSLISLLEQRRAHLLSTADQQAETKRALVRDQLAHCSGHVARTRGLIQFNIELLKEPEPLAYLQVGNAMAHRIVQQLEDVDREGWSSATAEERTIGASGGNGIAEFSLTLDTRELQGVIAGTDFSQMKRELLAVEGGYFY